jgi:biopolymer transport protein TolQ
MQPFVPPTTMVGWWDAIIGASLFAKIVMSFLLLLSIISWAIAIKKSFLFRAIKRENKTLLSLFQHRSSVTQFQRVVNDYRNSPLAKILACGIKEWESLKLQTQKTNPTLTRSTNPGPTPINAEVLTQLLPNISESMNRTSTVELERTERFIPFLASVSSASPFLGLLGTVWGIVDALLNIRNVPVVTLQVIAPGISDALVTTVAGLLVAIPALMLYNYYLGKLKDLSSETERFMSEIISDFRKEIVLNQKKL